MAGENVEAGEELLAVVVVGQLRGSPVHDRVMSSYAHDVASLSS